MGIECKLRIKMKWNDCMSIWLNIATILTGLILIVIIFNLMVNKKMSEAQSVLWIGYCDTGYISRDNIFYSKKDWYMVSSIDNIFNSIYRTFIYSPNIMY